MKRIRTNLDTKFVRLYKKGDMFYMKERRLFWFWVITMKHKSQEEIEKYMKVDTLMRELVKKERIM